MAVLAYTIIAILVTIIDANSDISDMTETARSFYLHALEKSFLDKVERERKKFPSDVPVVLYIEMQCSWDDAGGRMVADSFNLAGSQTYKSKGQLPPDSPYQGWLEGELLMSEGLKGLFRNPPRHDKWIKGSWRRDYWRGGPGEPQLNFVAPMWTVGLGKSLKQRKDVETKILPEHQDVRICNFGGVRVEATFYVDGKKYNHTINSDSIQWSFSGPKGGLEFSQKSMPSVGEPGKNYKNFKALQEGVYLVIAKPGGGATVNVKPPVVKKIIIKPENPQIAPGQTILFRAWAEFEESCIDTKEITKLATWKPSGSNIYTAPELNAFEPSGIKLKCVSHPNLTADICEIAELEANIKFEPQEDIIIAKYGQDKYGKPAKGEAKITILPSDTVKVNSQNTNPLVIWKTPSNHPSFQIEQFEPIGVSVELISGIASDSLTINVNPHESLFKMEETSIPRKIKVGEKAKLKAVELYCEGTEPNYRPTENVKWESNNNEVLKVGSRGSAIGIKPGKTVVKLYDLSSNKKAAITSRPIQVYSDKPSFIADSNQKFYLWAEKRGTWCFFEYGEQDKLQQLKEDMIWHKIMDGPLKTLEMVEASYDRKAKTAKPISIIGYGKLHYHKVDSDICFIGRENGDHITDEHLARRNPPLETILKQEMSEKGPTTWTINIRVIDKETKEGITGACIKRRGPGFTCEAKDLGGGNYKLGPIANNLNLKRKKVDLIAQVYHVGKGANRKRYFLPETVVLEESSIVNITFPFSFIKGGIDEQKPSFIRASGKGKNKTEVPKDHTPSFIKSSTTKTTPAPSTTAVHKPSAQPKSIPKKVQSQTKYQPAAIPQPKIQKQPQKSKKLQPQKITKLTYEQCVKKFCPMCSFLFGARPSLDNLSDDECGRCMKANEGNINQCLKENR
jgi:hypothetical protein